MIQSESTPQEGEKVEAQSDEIVGLFHGTTPADIDLDVKPRGCWTCGYVEIDLRGPPSLSALLTEEQAKGLVSELTSALASMEDPCCTEADYDNGQND